MMMTTATSMAETTVMNHLSEQDAVLHVGVDSKDDDGDDGHRDHGIILM